ncbi:MAG: rod shape-determining protein RodA [Pseudomonadota bacterium]
MSLFEVSRRQQSATASAQIFHLDIPLLLGLVTLCIAGLLILYSASGQDLVMVERQLVRLTLGFAVMAAIAQLRPTTLLRWTPWLYGVGVILLIAVFFFGDIGKGAQRWLELGPFRFQPSELMKLAVPMMVAWYLHERPLPVQKRKLFVAVLIIMVPTLLVAEQPDLGTAILIAAAGVIVLLLSGVQYGLIAVFAGLLAAVAPIVWFFLLHDYQRRRVWTFLDPEQDPLGAGYHTIQAKIAIGSGGLFGKGWFNGTQSQLDFLPERHTDFIFAVLAEEFGFLGAALLLLIYLIIIFRGLYISVLAQETYNRLLAGSLIFTFFVYVFVNMGMVSGILPVVGVPLPLVSYGGTSMVTLMAGFGILMSIHTHRTLHSK